MLWRAPSRCTQDVVFAAKWPYPGGPKSGEGASFSYRGWRMFIFSLSIHWISFHGFMSYILLLYDTTLAWSALFSYRRVVELSVTTENVLICCDGKTDSTGHIPLSTFQRNLIFFNLTQEVYGEDFGGRGFKSRKHVCCTSPQPALCFPEIRG